VTGPELAVLANRRLTRAMITANVVGAGVVFVFLDYLLPVNLQDAHGPRTVNIAVFVAFMAVSCATGKLLGDRIAAPMCDWLDSELPATGTDRRNVLRQPLRQTRLNGSIWLAAAVLFGGLNLFYDPGLALDIVTTIVLGAFATCGIAYLLAERCLRPVVTRVMNGVSEPPPTLLGVMPRLVLAWALGTGIPLIGVILGLTAPTHTHAPLTRTGVLFLVGVALTVGLVAMTAAAGAVSDPVRSVAAALRQVGNGTLDVEVPVYDASEVGRLQSGFNAMVQGLRERDRLRDLFGRQVGDDVARLALERGTELGGELRDVAVLFVDVVGSTSLALELEPKEVVRRLNAFFAVVIDVVQEHGGWVNKFEGDAALCVFGAPVQQPDPGTCALSAARTMAERLQGLPVDAAIGVCAGPVVAGHVGAESRFEYTVIGDPVNTAARLTELAKASAGCVLADAALLKTGSDEASHWVVGEEVVLRGRRTATTLARPR
jgi:adenylate cyclase